ncbi:unnamed protein product [Caenorhabditis angaria]|uniref:Uncharacterized protein n=1 Tax=Caenorhabditis angaria TaxID=860376 RepID=A0A9P1N191_9PELO|nr:unnamed protein product [Caenorhabditis angaria]
MLLQRSLLIVDAICLVSIVVCLAFLPAERCATFEHQETTLLADEKCQTHPAAHLEDLNHLTTVCHRMSWSHYAFWRNMCVLILPAICCTILILFIFIEMFDLDTYFGRIKNSWIILFSIFTIVYTFTVIIFEQYRVHKTWNIKLGASEPINLQSPDTWWYSLLMCVLSALFKIARIVVQHYFGDKKMRFDEDTSSRNKNSHRSFNQ